MKLEKLFSEWKNLKKSKSRTTATQKKNEQEFIEKNEELFDISHANAMDIMDEEEDKKFLEMQRKKGRPGIIGGIDRIKIKREKKKDEKLQKYQMAKMHSEEENKKLSETVELIDSNSGESDEMESEGPSTSHNESYAMVPKRGRQNILTPELAAMLDRNFLSSRAAMMIIYETAKALGKDPQKLALNRTTIERERQKFRECSSATMKYSFQPETILTIHWDSKLMCDLVGVERVDRLAIIASTMGEEKLIGIPKITSGTGESMAKAIYDIIVEWDIKRVTQGMCFDTTASNTGQFNGACENLQKLMGKELLSFACRHHIFELVLSSAFTSCLGSVFSPDVQLFKRFKSQWHLIRTQEFEDINSDEINKCKFNEDRDDIILFCENQLKNYQPRDDYLELLEIILIFLGKTPPRGIKFRAPGAMHQARWMARAIYCLKIWLFRKQFTLTSKEVQGLQEFNIFVVKVYIKSWFQAPQASTAARNDLHLLHQLYTYPNKDISENTVNTFKRHLWYLSEELILLSLFDEEISPTEKRAMLEASMSKDGKKKIQKRAEIDITTIDFTSYSQFVTKSSRKLFTTLSLPDEFLTEDPNKWKDLDDYKASRAIVCSLATVNDFAERSIALIKECTNSGRFKNEDQLQCALQVIEENRKKFPDAKKSSLSKY